MPLVEAAAPRTRTNAVRDARLRTTPVPFRLRKFVAQMMHFRPGRAATGAVRG